MHVCVNVPHFSTFTLGYPEHKEATFFLPILTAVPKRLCVTFSPILKKMHPVLAVTYANNKEIY